MLGDWFVPLLSGCQTKHQPPDTECFDYVCSYGALRCRCSVCLRHIVVNRVISDRFGRENLSSIQFLWKNPRKFSTELTLNEFCNELQKYFCLTRSEPYFSKVIQSYLLTDKSLVMVHITVRLHGQMSMDEQLSNGPVHRPKTAWCRCEHTCVLH